MVIFIVFVVVIAAIGLAVYGGSIASDPICYIAGPECPDCGAELSPQSCRCPDCDKDWKR